MLKLSALIKKDIKLIEGVQRRATKLVKYGMQDLSYNDRLQQLGLLQLEG